jgi:hypothetical protein
MPSSKTDTAIRFPEKEDQTRRLRNVTQDRKAVSQLQDEARSNKNKADDVSSWGTGQLLGTGIDESAHPVPDPVHFGSGRKMRQNQQQEDDADVYEAMTQDFD